jgi:signal peptidase I
MEPATPSLVRSGIEQAGWPTLVRAWVVLTIGALVVARGVVRTFFVEAFTIPSGSMYPTLVVGDHIFIDRRGWTPRRGDVIVFQFPLDRSVDYIKRVIGLPGDVVEVSNGNVSVNGQVLARERLVDGCPEGADGLPAVEENIPCEIWSETIEGRSYRVGTERSSGGREVPRTVVPAGTVYVVGDNRDNSSDSRVWGPVPLENVKGEVRFIWWSRDRAGVRWDRVDTLVP